MEQFKASKGPDFKEVFRKSKLLTSAGLALFFASCKGPDAPSNADMDKYLDASLSPQVERIDPKSIDHSEETFAELKKLTKEFQSSSINSLHAKVLNDSTIVFPGAEGKPFIESNGDTAEYGNHVNFLADIDSVERIFHEDGTVEDRFISKEYIDKDGENKLDTKYMSDNKGDVEKGIIAGVLTDRRTGIIYGAGRAEHGGDNFYMLTKDGVEKGNWYHPGEATQLVEVIEKNIEKLDKEIKDYKKEIEELQKHPGGGTETGTVPSDHGDSN